jgi:hypothetical protein
MLALDRSSAVMRSERSTQTCTPLSLRAGKHLDYDQLVKTNPVELTDLWVRLQAARLVKLAKASARFDEETQAGLAAREQVHLIPLPILTSQSSLGNAHASPR